MNRVFLDANILFSAAYVSSEIKCGIKRLWELKEVQLISSRYAVEEARRNLNLGEQRERLESFIKSIEIIEDYPSDFSLPDDVRLPEKDRPILISALAAKADYLITGDVTHFGRYFGKRIKNLVILPPSDYLRIKKNK